KQTTPLGLHSFVSGRFWFSIHTQINYNYHISLSVVGQASSPDIMMTSGDACPTFILILTLPRNPLK
ncbi:MAG: hypothetical protein NUV74_14030, partial [Candidatus Brocadiaceae bacterium]|nr:hypothetical protein [Candidatus Brocadiaceae bacterium]